MYSKFAPDDPGTRVSARRRSEGIISRVASLFENDREKEKRKTEKKQTPVPLRRLGFAKKMPFRDVQMML